MRLYDEIADAMEAEAREQTADGRLSRAAVLQDWAARIRAMAPARDESVPPPGFAAQLAPWSGTLECYCRGKARVRTLAEAWAIYDREHGYAPTVPPLPEGWGALPCMGLTAADPVQVEREAIADYLTSDALERAWDRTHRRKPFREYAAERIRSGAYRKGSDDR
jgi:hypothetical protein